MSKRTSTAFWIISSLALALFCALGLPMLHRSTNCGGNSAAISACRDIVLSLRTVSLDRGGEPVSVANLTGPERENFHFVAGMSWLPKSRVLVAASPIAFNQQSREIVAVCDTPFDNVPRPMFGHAPLTHAAGYSDGTAGLISVQEFRRLDLSRFIDVRTIVSPKVEPGGPASRPAGSETNQTSLGVPR